MKVYVQLDEFGNIKQISAGLNNPLWENAIEAPIQIIYNPYKWKYIDGTWAQQEIEEYPQPEEPTLEQRLTDLELAIASILGGAL